jgi:hypothetical protein
MNGKLRNSLTALLPILLMASCKCSPSQGNHELEHRGTNGCVIDVQPHRGPGSVANSIQVGFDQPLAMSVAGSLSRLKFTAPYKGAFSIEGDSNNQDSQGLPVVYLDSANVQKLDQFEVDLILGTAGTLKGGFLAITQARPGSGGYPKTTTHAYNGIRGATGERVTQTSYPKKRGGNVTRFKHLVTAVRGNVSMTIVIKTASTGS